MSRLLYDYGLPFSLPVVRALDQSKERVMVLNKASFFIIDGSVGSGKSVASVHYADYWNGAYKKIAEKMYEQDKTKFIDLELQYAMGSKDFMKKLVLCYKAGKNVLIYDEAGDFSKRGSLTKLNQELNRIFEVCRAFKIIIIFVMPNFFYIDRSVLDKEMIRGLFRIDRDSNNYSNFKLWDINGINWLKWRSLKLPIPNQCYKFQSPIAEGNILPLDQERMDKLAKMSNKDKINVVTEISIRVPQKAKGLVTKAEIMSAYNVSGNTVWQFLKNHNIVHKDLRVKAKLFDPKEIERVVKKWGMNGLPPKEEV